MNRYLVTFVYADEQLDQDDEWDEWDAQMQSFASRAEAEAFQMGLEWGDEPKFTVVRIAIGEDS